MEAAMINDVVLEGIVVKAWKYAQATSRSSASWMGCTKEGQADLKDMEAISDREIPVSKTCCRCPTISWREQRSKYYEEEAP